MDGRGLNDQTLRRMIALLVSFAVLAERAAGRSFPVRWLVLTIVRHAETVVLDLLADTVQVDFSGLDDDPAPGHEPYDAAVLGWRLRMLAAMLGTLLKPEARFESWTAGRDAAPRGLAQRADILFAILNGRRPAFHDTS